MKKSFLLLLLIISLTNHSFKLPITQAQTSTDPITIVFVGASNTEEGYRANVSYVSRLSSFGDPWQDANLVNEGHAGWGMFSYFEKPTMIAEHVIKYEPNYVFIYLGGNDVVTGRGGKLNQSYRYFLETLDQLDVNNTIKQVFMINFNWGLWLLTATDADIADYQKDRQMYVDIANDFDLLLLDFHDTFENHTEYFIEGDGHINDLGHQVIAEQIHLTTADIIAPPISSSLTTVSSSTVSSTTVSQTELTNSTKESLNETNTTDSLYPTPMIHFFAILIVFKFRSRKLTD
ncbi:MAG: SGNH/GDSL hydrolase family protein [Candidatus Heimdallarchaeota archaeon]|nr:SGNH/GDSL hydrolase family protein [Candidatus Heimdallarchaeota archaeon]